VGTRNPQHQKNIREEKENSTACASKRTIFENQHHPLIFYFFIESENYSTSTTAVQYSYFDATTIISIFIFHHHHSFIMTPRPLPPMLTDAKQPTLALEFIHLPDYRKKEKSLIAVIAIVML
jgi:hypothetical protein